MSILHTADYTAVLFSGRLPLVVLQFSFNKNSENHEKWKTITNISHTTDYLKILININ